MIVNSQQNRIEFVTRPGAIQEDIQSVCQKWTKLSKQMDETGAEVKRRQQASTTTQPPKKVESSTGDNTMQQVYTLTMTIKGTIAQ